MYSQFKENRENCPRFKLTYFNLRGRAETIRLVLAAAEIAYIDDRIDQDRWRSLKTNTPWGGVPVLEEDGRTLGQSVAIARYIAREAGLMGQTSFDQAMVDSVVDAVTDLREKGANLRFMAEGPDKIDAAKEFEEKTLPNTLSNLERFLKLNDEGQSYFVGNKLTLADLHFYSVMEIVMLKYSNALHNYPLLLGLFERIQSTPSISSYLQRRQDTPF